MVFGFVLVDVFSDRAFGGNQLAVFPDAAGIADETMQRLAREFNFSETTFVLPPSDPSCTCRVRIFTPREELPFAGHPTLGTAAVLKADAPETVRSDTVTLALGVGPVPVRFEEGKAGAAGLFGEMTQRDPEFGAELDPEIVARLAGLSADDLDPALPPQVVSTGTAFAIVALRSQAALERLKVNQDEAVEWLRERGARWFYVLAPSVDEKL